MKPTPALKHALETYIRTFNSRLHVPGHRGGPGAPLQLDTFGSLLAYDVTELPMTDDLHRPSGPLLQMHQRAAQAFGGEQAWVLVNGATAGVLAMMWAALRPEDTVIMARGVHRSAVSGLILTGARPAFMPERIDAASGLALGPDLAGLEETIRAHPKARVLLLTYPNYHGSAIPLDAMIRLAHAHEMTVLVDQAHGAHFGSDPALPPAAMELGADAAVLGLHKQGGALTQTGLLLAQGARLDRARLAEGTRLWQSTSPSYLLLMSAEAAIEERLLGLTQWQGTISLSRTIQEGSYAHRLFQARHPYRQDPAKVMVRVGKDAPQWRDFVGRQLRLQAEYADHEHVLFCLGPNLTRVEAARLVQALKSLPEANAAPKLRMPSSGPMQMLPRQAVNAARVVVPLNQAAGAVAAGVVGLSPPGVPIWMPGETINPESVAFLEAALAQGRICQGLEDGGVAVVK